MVELAATIFADGPSTNPNQPMKPLIRDWGTWLEQVILAFTSGAGNILKTSRAALFADLGHAASTSAWVMGDPNVAYNGIYVKSGASGTGSWARVSDLPFSFIIASDVGAGTPNAIQATTSIPVSGSALVWTNIVDTNTSSPVTISFNGGSPLTIKTNSGNNPSPAGGLQAGMIVLGIVQGTTFRLVSDQTSASLLAQVEAVVDGIDVGAFATAAQGTKADTAVQRQGAEEKVGDLTIRDGLLKAYKNLQTIPTAPDLAGMVVSFNRSDEDGETNIRNMYVNGTGMTKAFVLSQITTAGIAEVDLMTLYRNGRMAVGSIGWLEAIATQAETVSMFTSLSKPGGPALAITGASRTSDAVAPAYFSSIGIWGYSDNNRARSGDFNTTFMGWGGYFENRRRPGSGRSHGVEIGSVNHSDGTDLETVRMTPYDYGQANSINALLLSAGRPDVGSSQRDISNAINIIQNGPPGHQVSYLTGINFGANSVRADGPTVPAIQMPTLYHIRWYTTEGLRSYIGADQTTGSQLIGISYRNTTIDFEYQGAIGLTHSVSGVRAVATNGGFDATAVYVGNTTASRQFRFVTYDASFPNLYFEANTNTHASPTWTNRGTFNATTGAYTNVSDETVKRDFRVFDRDISQTIRGLADAVCLYRMKDDPDEEWLGFKAQGVNEILPEAVTLARPYPGSTVPLLMLEDRPIVAAHSLAIADIYSRLELLEAA